MKTSSRLSRRSFLARASGTAAVALLARKGFSAGEPRQSAFKVAAEQVRGLAINARGHAVIAADHKLLFYTLNGTLLRELATAQPVRALCFDSQGRLFATFKDQVASLNDTDGWTTLDSPLGRESALTGLAVADDGTIFAADSGKRLIWRMDSTGAVKGQVKASENGFSVPRAFFPVHWRNGALIAADPGRHQIHRFSAEGKLLSTWGQRSREVEGFGGCCNPVSFAPLADGTIVTAERGQPRVKVFSAQGQFARLLAGPEEFTASSKAAKAEPDDVFGCQGGLLDVAEAAGRIVVLDRTTRELRVLA
jgi:hypothetical protein